MNSSQNQQVPISAKERRVFIILIVLGLSLTIFFGFRAVRSYIRIQRTGLTTGTADVDAIRGWMTIPYIADGYGVPAEYIFQEIEIPAQENLKKSLSQLNRQYAFGEKGKIVEVVKAAIRNYQKESPSPSTSGHE